MTRYENMNEWFLSLPEGRQKVLREDKWMLANAAFAAGRAAALKDSPDEGQLETWRSLADDLPGHEKMAPTYLIRNAALQLQNAYLSWRHRK